METDEITITMNTLSVTIKQSFEMGEKQMKDRVLDLIADQLCNHGSSCPKCEAYEFLMDMIGEM